MKKILFTVIAIFLSLLILETAFRVMYSIKYRSLAYLTYAFSDVFKFDFEFFDEYIKLKAPLHQHKEEKLYLGFRTPPFPIQKPKGEYRVVALGGSSTYGIINDTQHTYPALLEKKLNGRLKEKSEYQYYRVINCGVGWQGTHGINKLLSAEVFGWNPDLIIIYSLYNHVFKDVPTLYNAPPSVDYLFRKIKGLLFKKSLLVTYLVQRIGLDSRFTFQNKMESYRYLLSEIVQKCKKMNVDVFIVKQLIRPEAFPMVRLDVNRRELRDLTGTSGNYLAGANASEQYAIFLNIIDEIGEKYKGDCIIVDFSAYSPTCVGRFDKLLVDNVHLKDSGNDVFAEVLYENIKKRLSRQKKI